MAIRGNTEKISVTLPRELAGEIRSIVAQGQVSSFFTKALAHYLAFRKQQQALEKGFGAWSDQNHTDLITPQDSTSYVRNIRQTDNQRQEHLGGINAR